MEDLSNKLKLYIFPLLFLGCGISIWIFADRPWWNWWILVPVLLAVITQLFKVESVLGKSNHNIGWMIYGFTLVLLGAPATLFTILVANLVEWAWKRYSWYIPTFTIAAYAMAVFAAKLVYDWINPQNVSLTIMGTLGVLGAIAAFTIMNRLLVGLFSWMSGGLRGSKFNSFTIFGLMIDYTLISLGAAAAFIWMISPSAAIFSVIPLYLIFITFKYPALK
jgi:hypothetical protein